MSGERSTWSRCWSFESGQQCGAGRARHFKASGNGRRTESSGPLPAPQGAGRGLRRHPRPCFLSWAAETCWPPSASSLTSVSSGATSGDHAGADPAVLIANIRKQRGVAMDLGVFVDDPATEQVQWRRTPSTEPCVTSIPSTSPPTAPTSCPVSTTSGPQSTIGGRFVGRGGRGRRAETADDLHGAAGHTELRALASRAFTPRGVADLEPRVRRGPPAPVPGGRGGRLRLRSRARRPSPARPRPTSSASPPSTARLPGLYRGLVGGHGSGRHRQGSQHQRPVRIGPGPASKLARR